MICPNCKIEYDENSEPDHHCQFVPEGIISPQPIQIDVIHPEWAIDIKISNDNTKGEKRATIHVRSDGDGMDAVKLAHQLYKEVLGS